MSKKDTVIQPDSSVLVVAASRLDDVATRNTALAEALDAALTKAKESEGTSSDLKLDDVEEQTNGQERT